MPRIDDLPADRRAVLQLLLKQGKSYDDLAALLRIEPEALRERARDALDQLGPADAAGLSPADQDAIADFLLGQQGASRRADTRTLLEHSAAGRAWARTVSGELRPLAGDALPEIPAERAEVDEAFDALSARKEARVRQAKSSRLGGALLLAAIGLAVAFLVIVLISSSGSDDGGASTSSSTSTPTASATTSTTPQVLGQVNLKAPAGSGGKALAAVTLVKQGDETDILFQGQAIPANRSGDVYALWLTGTSAPARLGFTPRVKANGKLRFPGALPATVDLTKYTTMELTRETTPSPKTPGPVVVAGALRTAG